MLFACDGRLAAMATVAVIAISIGHKFLPRYAGLAFVPIVTGLALFATYTAGLRPGVDDLSGRIHYTADLIGNMTLIYVAGFPTGCFNNPLMPVSSI